jgi:hypothetical protein
MKRRSLLGPMIAGGIGVALLTAALTGWAMALSTIGTFTGLNADLAKTKAELAKTKADLSMTAEALVRAREAMQEIPRLARDREELIKQVGSLRAERAHLEARIGEGTAALDRLGAELKHRQDLLSGSAPAYVTTGWARLRSEASIEAKEIAVVTAGASLRVFETVADGRWHKVGSIGFMHHTLLEPAAATLGQ